MKMMNNVYDKNVFLVFALSLLFCGTLLLSFGVWELKQIYGSLVDIKELIRDKQEQR